jgi:hypothetical protein
LQVAVVPVPLRVQLPDELKAPLPLLVKLTLPAGVLAVPESVSLTVAVQVVAEPTPAEPGVQLTDVEDVRLSTVNVSALDVALPPPLPGLITVTLCVPRAAAAEVIVRGTLIVVLLLIVGVPAVTPEPLIATVLAATKFVPASVSVTVVPRSLLPGDTLERVGAIAVVEYVAV